MINDTENFKTGFVIFCICVGCIIIGFFFSPGTTIDPTAFDDIARELEHSQQTIDNLDKQNAELKKRIAAIENGVSTIENITDSAEYGIETTRQLIDDSRKQVDVIAEQLRSIIDRQQE
jgi:peptidoglycan hydrolase CwlO-like protein